MSPLQHNPAEELGSSNVEANSSGLKLRRVNELKVPPPTKWLGKGWVPRGEITVLVGAEGIGKSLLWVLFASLVTTGKAFPMFNWPPREPADVVVIVTEDSASEVYARLSSAGADLSRVIFFCSEEDGSGIPTFTGGDNGDMLLLHGLLEELPEPPAMLILDAWLDTVGGNLNVRDTQQARAALHPWKNLAQRHALAVLLVTHTNRLDTSNTRDLMGGTAALRQKARMVLFAGRPSNSDDSEHQQLWVGPDKANTTGLVNAVRFQVEVLQARDQTDDDPGTTARLSEPANADKTIGQLVALWKREEVAAGRKPTTADKARNDLATYVATHGGSVPAKDLSAHLGQLGYGKSAIEQAKKDCGVSAPIGYKEPWIFTLTNKGKEPGD